MSNRILWVDNLKGLFIFLVVLGHMFAGVNVDLFKHTHYFIYCVHMPMFMLVSGYLSKKPTNLRKIFKNYIIPYVVFDFLYAIFIVLFHHGALTNLNVLVPIYVYWYILCLGLLKVIIGSRQMSNLLLIIALSGGGNTHLLNTFNYK